MRGGGGGGGGGGVSVLCTVILFSRLFSTPDFPNESSVCTVLWTLGRWLSVCVHTVHEGSGERERSGERGRERDLRLVIKG